MLKLVKKLILSNKYALLVLLILSLWLKLARDYNIFLSYLILIVLYLAVGVLVEMLLDRFFPGFASSDWSFFGQRENNAETFQEEEPEEKPVSTVRNSDVRRYSARNTTIERKRIPQEQPQPRPRTFSGVNRTESRAEISRPPIATSHASRSEQPEPKVTSSYIKNAGSIPRDVERKLVRTAADFHSIKQNSDRLNTKERYSGRASGTARSLFSGDPESLYTNVKKKTKSETDPEAKEQMPEFTERDAVSRKAEESLRTEKPTMPEFSYFPPEDYKTASTDELDEISEKISREVERRVNAPKPVRRARVILPDESLDAPIAPVRRTAFTPETDLKRNTESDRKLVDTAEVLDPAPKQEIPVRRTVRPELHAPVGNTENYDWTEETSSEEDKVSADMDKIDRLFNRNRADQECDGGETQNKTGLWNRFKKKRK